MTLDDDSRRRNHPVTHSVDTSDSSKHICILKILFLYVLYYTL